MHNEVMGTLVRCLAAISVLGLLLTGCSSHDSMDIGTQSSTEMADIAFAQMMIPYGDQWMEV